MLRLVVELDGETVVSISPDLGYLHSGFEKTGENKRYKDFVYYSDRMDYLSAMLNNFGYVLTVEKLLGVEIPQRAQVIRVMMTELQRIASHLFWLSTHVLDVSGTGMSLLMYATASANAFSTCSRWCAVRVSRSATSAWAASARICPTPFSLSAWRNSYAPCLRAWTTTSAC